MLHLAMRLLVRVAGLEPAASPVRGEHSTKLSYTLLFDLAVELVWVEGFEPPAPGFQVRYSAQTELHPETKNPARISPAGSINATLEKDTCHRPAREPVPPR